jgi:DUF1009 family protein
MDHETQEPLGIIAGRGVYPRMLARSARKQGVPRISAVAFRRETDPVIEQLADDVQWLRVGQLKAMLDYFQATGVSQVVMAGQIAPHNLFRLRPDRMAWELLAGLPQRNAHTIFGAIGDRLRDIGIELKSASTFMEDAMPGPGRLTRRGPTEREKVDIALGLTVGHQTSALDIGQTVAVKEGVVLAVEAFEGTDATIRRAGKLGGPGAIVIKVAKRGHDMRFDIPVVGERTIRVMRTAHAGGLALQAKRCILLDPDRVVALADRFGMCIVAEQETEDP